MLSHRLLALLVSGFLILPSISSSRAEPGAGKQLLTITVVNCSQDLNAIPFAFLGPRFGKTEVPLSATLVKLSRGLHQLTATVDAGYHSLRVKTQHCWAFADLSILPGHSRHLTIATGRALPLDHEYCSVSGMIPTGVSLYLVNPRGVDVDVVIDDGAYYADGLHRGIYTLLVKLSNWRRFNLSFDFTNGPFNELNQCVAHQRRDISVDDLKRAGY